MDYIISTMPPGSICIGWEAIGIQLVFWRLKYNIFLHGDILKMMDIYVDPKSPKKHEIELNIMQRNLLSATNTV